jgi:two-component system chemotaxis response regulator CheB
VKRDGESVKKVVVIGGSAGGISALCSILRKLPADFPAPVLGVIHVDEHSSHLAEVLQRCSELKVADPVKPEPIRPGHVYIAPSNRHLIVKSGCAMAVMGPRENRHRPSVDTLFRSAARNYRRAVVAVVLSGALDDGSAGALAVKARGGTVIVQDPNEAQISDMPANVLKQVKSARCMRLEEIPAVLLRLASSNGTPTLPEVKGEHCTDPEDVEVAKDNEPLAMTCPDCGGALLETRDGKTRQWRCHVGHRFSLNSFTDAQSDAVERALWVAIRKLREREAIQEQLAKDRSIRPELRKRYKENGAAAAGDIQLLEEVLTRL